MDKRRQELEELQDDIHLALLMDEYAESIGAQARAEAEKAFETGEITIPQEMDHAYASILAQTAKAEHSRKSYSTVSKHLLVAAASIVLLLGSLVVVQASGIDVFGRLASWTDSVFYFGSLNKSAQSEEEPLMEITTALRDLGLPTELAPRRLPVGYSVTGLIPTEMDDMKYLGISVEKDNHEGYILIEEFLDPRLIENALWEKNTHPVRAITVNNRLFYLFQNEPGWSGLWTDGRLLISLHSFESYEDLVFIIQSIGE